MDEQNQNQTPKVNWLYADILSMHDLACLVDQMRQYQALYFANRLKSTLETCRAFERRVDKVTHEILLAHREEGRRVAGVQPERWSDE